MHGKDHFTDFHYLKAISRKDARIVAHEIMHAHSVLGYPSVFHTDNGTEFMKEVLLLVKQLNPLCVTVTGRPREPSDQGDIEVTHRLIRQVLNKCIAEAKERCSNAEERADVVWTTQLSNTMAVMNSSKFLVGKVTPYECVFGGRMFDDPMYSELQGKSVQDIVDVEQMCLHLSVKSSLTQKCFEWGYLDDDNQTINQTINSESQRQCLFHQSITQ